MGLNKHGCLWCLNIHGYKGCLNIIFYIGCVNIYGTHLTTNNFPDNLVLFFVSDLKYYTISTINLWSQCLGQEKKNILCHLFFGDKIIQNCLKIDATH